MKRILILCFTLLLVLGQITPVHADTESEGTIDLVDTFYVTTSREDHSLHVPYNSSWFRNDARVYNHDIAKLSLGLATSAFRPSKKLAEEKQSQDYNARSFMEQAGFVDLRSDDYDKAPSMYTVSTVMGHQKISDGEGGSFELIAIGICGQGYMDEWESNLSVGKGKHPEGFYNAAHLVYDRVFGYISENHIRGKMKIWVSGFSRAAAISNIAASLLSDSYFFSQENVFAYTFATPMTVRDTEPKPYENIFNICGKMDPVTNVPFADWGYSRYGITYYTPAIETDSDFWKKRVEADKVYKAITGINYWINPDMNSQLRVLMDCLLSICPDAETYCDSLQGYLINLWKKHDFYSVLNCMLEMANDPLLITDDNRTEANIMMNQISHLLIDYVSADNSFRRFNSKASVGSNILQAHTPELYVSWVFSVDDPAELYSDSTVYKILYVNADADITLYRDKAALEFLAAGTRNVSSNRYLGVRDEKISVLIPGDREYEVCIHSNADQKMEALDAIFEIGGHAPEETIKYTSKMKAGDEINIGYNKYGRAFLPSGKLSISMTQETEASNTSIDIVLNAYSFPDGLSWRDLVLFILMVIVLLITTVLFIITILPMWIRHRYKREHGYIPEDARFRPLPIICVFLIQQVFLTKEFFTALYEPSPTVTNFFKILIGFLVLIIAIYGYRRIKNRFHRLIIYAVILLTGADVMMTTSIAAGAVLYIAAYILLCINYSRIDHPGVFRIIVWIIMSVVGIYLMSFLKGDFGYLLKFAYFYIVAGTALVVTSFTHSARISRGSTLLFIAGILIIINTATGNNFFLHFVSAALHYIAVCILASTGSGFSLPIIIPEYVSESEQEMA